MDLSIVRICYCVRVEIPILWVITYVVSQGLDQSAIESLHLPITFWVVSRRCDVLRAEASAHFLEELGHKLCTVVTQDTFRGSVNEHPVPNEGSSNFCGRNAFERNCPHQFGKPVGYHEEVAITTFSANQLAQEINSDELQRFRCWKQFHACRVATQFDAIASARCARASCCIAIQRHRGPVIQAPKGSVKLTSTWMSGRFSVVAKR